MSNLPYAYFLRSAVGAAPLILVAIGVAPFDEQERLLLQRRSDGQWGIPGGHLEPGEALEEAAVREVREDTGLHVPDLEVLGIASVKASVVERGGAKSFYVTVIYRSQSYSGVPRASEESLAVGFFDVNDLPKPLSPAVTGVLEHLEVRA